MKRIIHKSAVDHGRPVTKEGTRRDIVNARKIQNKPIVVVGISKPKANATRINVKESAMQNKSDITTIKPVSNTSNINVTTNLPPLETIVQNNTIVGDPQFILDFCILGFAKAGTTTMQNLLCNHPEAQCHNHEVRDLLKSKPARLVTHLYELQNNTRGYIPTKRGYKNPNDIGQANVMKVLRTYWPQTKVFVGIRHPVHWLQSFYNFRQQNNRGSMPPANKLIGGCFKGRGGLCTDRGLFHIMLARLLKTDMSAPEELEMMQGPHHRWFQDPLNHSLPNPLFLFATEQLSDKNTTRLDVLRNDVQEYDEKLHMEYEKEYDRALAAAFQAIQRPSFGSTRYPSASFGVIGC